MVTDGHCMVDMQVIELAALLAVVVHVTELPLAAAAWFPLSSIVRLIPPHTGVAEHVY